MGRTATLTKETIVDEGLRYAEANTIHKLCISQIGKALDRNPSLISFHYKLHELRDAVLCRAAELKKWEIVAQGLAGDMPDEVTKDARRKALNYLARKHRIRKIH